ncbi:hypothetical protein GCK32_022766 [Trichostrongylus colubriformis]|uniref:Uncharacterized protein n=1 Tax=Trichostrongylus colubriformis TaxID=6319 RepID=A0AAN8F064_TRICO
MPAGTIRYHFSLSETELAKNLIRNTYVDHIFYSVDTNEQGKKFYTESKDLFQKAGIILRQYVSNFKELNEFFDKEKGTTDMSNANEILGIFWNSDEDSFVIRPAKVPNSGTVDKTTSSEVSRENLRSVSKRFL